MHGFLIVLFGFSFSFVAYTVARFYVCFWKINYNFEMYSLNTCIVYEHVDFEAQ